MTTEKVGLLGNTEQSKSVFRISDSAPSIPLGHSHNCMGINQGGGGRGTCPPYLLEGGGHNIKFLLPMFLTINPGETGYTTF